MRSMQGRSPRHVSNCVSRVGRILYSSLQCRCKEDWFASTLVRERRIEVATGLAVVLSPRLESQDVLPFRLADEKRLYPVYHRMFVLCTLLGCRVKNTIDCIPH
jgi:hypothetical protein